MFVTQLEPYDCRMVRGGFFSQTYDVTFEGQTIRTIEGTTEGAMEEFIFLLNAAYQGGYADGAARGVPA